jgi:tetratricopeptide (TPR) repeat protein
MGLSPDSHRTRLELQRAERAAQAQNWSQAAFHMARAGEYAPSRTGIWEQAGHFAMRAGETQTAVEYLEKGADEPGGLTAAGFVALGEAHWQNGSYYQAAQAWRSALVRSGPSVDLYQRMLQAHLALKDYPAAIADLETLASWQPGDGSLQYRLGLLLTAHNPPEALPHLEQAAKLDSALKKQADTLRQNIQAAVSESDPAYHLLEAGRGLASLNEWELAGEAFEQATSLRPDYAEAWAYLGEARQHLSDPVSSRKPVPGQTEPGPGLAELQKALALDPRSLATHTFLALYWSRQGRYDLALNAVEAAARLEPENPVLQVETGTTLALLGDLQTAEKAFRRAIELAPNDPAYWRLLAGFSLRYDYQVSEIALPAARKAVMLLPKDPANLDTMAQVLIKLDDQLNAQRFLDRAIQLDPEYAPAHLHLGLVYILKGDNEAAFEELSLARSLEPEGPTAEQANRLLETYFP